MAGLSINKDRILLPANGKILKGLSEEEGKDVFPVSHKYGFVLFLHLGLEIFKSAIKIVTVITPYIMCILYFQFPDYTTEQRQKNCVNKQAKNSVKNKDLFVIIIIIIIIIIEMTITSSVY